MAAPEHIPERTPSDVYETRSGFSVGGFFRHYHFPDRNQSPAPDESGLSDSIWAIIAGFVRGYNLPIEYVLYELSYANMILYSAVIPSYKSRDKKDGGGDGKKKQEEIKADDPSNKEKVRKFLDEIG